MLLINLWFSCSMLLDPSTYDGFLALAMQHEVHVRKRARTPGKTAPLKLRFLAANFVLYLFLILDFLLEIEIWVWFIWLRLSWNPGYLRTLNRCVKREPPACWSSGCMCSRSSVVGSLWLTSCCAHSRSSGVTTIALPRGFVLGCLRKVKPMAPLPRRPPRSELGRWGLPRPIPWSALHGPSPKHFYQSVCVFFVIFGLAKGHGSSSPRASRSRGSSVQSPMQRVCTLIL